MIFGIVRRIGSLSAVHGAVRIRALIICGNVFELGEFFVVVRKLDLGMRAADGTYAGAAERAFAVKAGVTFMA